MGVPGLHAGIHRVHRQRNVRRLLHEGPPDQSPPMVNEGGCDSDGHGNLEAPYQLTMSCYNGAEPACGKCPTCRSRRDAFRVNGLEDPIAYRRTEPMASTFPGHPRRHG